MEASRKSLVELPAELRIGGAPDPHDPGRDGSGQGGPDRGRGVPDGGAAARGSRNGKREPRFVMGVDGGATKTLAAVLDLDRRTVSLGRAGPSNEDSAGAQAAGRELLRAATEAAAKAGTGIEEVDCAVLAVAGTDIKAVRRHVRQSAPEKWIVVGDVVGAWAAATGARPGVGAIAGTGSNVFGVGPAGQGWRAGGWGHILGDEGSGYWIGLRSLAAVVHDRDGSGPRTRLTAEAIEFFKLRQAEDVVSLIYGEKPLGKSEIAAFAVRAAAAACAGDEVAAALYRQGAAELGAQVAAVIRETGLDALASPFPVGLIGSAFKAGEIFVGPLTETIATVAPAAEVAIAQAEPVVGPLMLALSACGAREAIAPDELQSLVRDQLERRPEAQTPVPAGDS